MNLSRIILLIIVLTASSLSSQTKQDLENQKKQIQEDIKKIELKLKTNSKQKKLIVSNAEDINYKIKLQQNLINNINSQLNLILREIDRNENHLSDLKQRELILKDELSKMLLSAYKKKSNLNKLMFVFSSTSFQQAYKRIQYFKQYVNFQNKTLSKIKINSNDIKNVIVVLDSQKTNKKLLIDENEEIKRDLSIEYTGLNNLIAEVNKNQKRYSGIRCIDLRKFSYQKCTYKREFDAVAFTRQV